MPDLAPVGSDLGGAVVALTIIALAVLALEAWTRIKERRVRHPHPDAIGVCIACERSSK